MNTPTPGPRRPPCDARRLCLALLAALASGGPIGCRATTPRAASKPAERAAKMTQLLEQQLASGDGNARDTAAQAGPDALPVLRKFVQAEGFRQRALALECLARLGAEETVETLARALDDPHIKVRYKAVRLLHRVHSPEAVPALRRLLAESADEWVRGNAALILGRLEDAAAVADIRQQSEREKDPRAAQQMTLALARLDDAEERKDLLDRLADKDHRVRYEAAGDFEYLNRPALIQHLLPLLDDKREVKNIGPEPFPVLHRVCDRAVEAVAALFPGKLTFPVGARTYSAEEIAQARTAASGG